MPVEVGTLVFVKTTNEPVFVLEMVAATPMLPGSLTHAKVRIPIATRDGIRHDVMTFSIAELETPEENMLRNRDLAEMQQRVLSQRIESAAAAAGIEIPKSKLTLN